MKEDKNRDIFLKETKIFLGLEIHITLNTKKKIFNWTKVYEGDEKPNELVGPWELGYPGFLPIINPEVIEKGIKLASFLQMKMENFIVFERKISTIHHFIVQSGSFYKKIKFFIANIMTGIQIKGKGSILVWIK